MSKLSELRKKTIDTSNAYFKVILKETGEVVAWTAMTISEDDNGLDALIEKNKGILKYVQITKDEYDEIIRPI